MPAPRGQRFVTGNICRALPRNSQQFAVHQVKHSLLHAALRQAGSFRKLSVAKAHRAFTGRRGQGEVDQECRCAVVMANKVSHQSVHDVRVDRIPPVAHCYSTSHRLSSRKGGLWRTWEVTCFEGSTTSASRPAIRSGRWSSGRRRWAALSPPTAWWATSAGSSWPSRARKRVCLLAPDGQEDRIGSFFNGSFGCDDVEYAYDKLRARGVEFTGPPEQKPFPHVYFKDPDGNTFFLSSR